MKPVDYGTVQRQTAGGRTAEREILGRVNARLRTADASSISGLAMLHEALRMNRNIWMTFAVDLASPRNPLPDQLKGQMISLAGFIERHTAQAAKDRTMLETFISINETIIAGLSGVVEEGAAA
jgi:flagellar protein FlaF